MVVDLYGEVHHLPYVRDVRLEVFVPFVDDCVFSQLRVTVPRDDVAQIVE